MPPQLAGPSEIPPRLRHLQKGAQAAAGERHHLAAQGTAQAALRPRTRFGVGRSSFPRRSVTCRSASVGLPQPGAAPVVSGGGAQDAHLSGQSSVFGARAAERGQNILARRHLGHAPL
ncbi:hypothetical protein NDU88_002852 [Pleurodeles waltl]|uniref:Uncharacterized protein n=1 Tax=Pleurodeles waltl TaxID=8319 RepID=A0AAV7TN09_PLEWA|nr:hypothetical protein NDU88_002852 [Pleurodeles waltl]